MSEFWKFVTGEWYFSIPMFFMSIAGIMLVFWRLLLNFNSGPTANAILPVLQDKLEKEGLDGAIKYCRLQQGIIPQKLFLPGLQTSRQGLAAMRRAMANAIELDILPDLNFLLAPILAIAKIATMVGLLGTVISMINTFTAISKATDAKGVTGHSSAIGLALFATALGLMTAIPLVFAHVLFKDWIAKYETRLKSAAQKLLIIVQAGRSTATPAAKPSANAASSVNVTAKP